MTGRNRRSLTTRRCGVVARIVTSILLVATILSGTGCAPSAYRGNWLLTSAPSGRVGIAYGDTLPFLSDADLAATLDDAVALGVKWIRLDLSWANIQPQSKQRYDWGRFDRVVQAAALRGLTPLPILAYTPPWARSSGCTTDKCPPAHPDDFAAFAQEAASRYRMITTWEVWNEPNTGGFWQPAPDPSAYGELLSRTAERLKHVNPNAQVIVGGLSIASPATGGMTPQDFVSALVREGATRNVDGVGLHPYTYPGLASERGPWVSPREDAASGLESIRRIFSDAGLAPLPIWITEFGAPTGGEAGSDDHVSEARQAEIASDAVKTAAADNGIPALIWYTYRDGGSASSDPEDHYGLRRADGSKKPAYDAFRQAISDTAG
jgi:polysaccharide biosynthesis protein PslG